MTAATDAAVKQVLHEALEPVALRKAADLANFARYVGSPIASFEVVLTDAEADELLDWIPRSGLIAPEGLPLLEADIAEARRRADPWLVLQHFTFSGFKTAPWRSLS